MDPLRPAVFDCTGGFPDTGVVAVDAVEDGGWVVAENIRVQNCSEDGFDTRGHGRENAHSGLRRSGNHRRRVIRGSRPTSSSTMIVLNGYGEGCDQCVSCCPVGESKMVVISKGRFALSGSSGGKVISRPLTNDAELFILGAEITTHPNGSGQALVKIKPLEADTFTHFTALRTWMHGVGGRALRNPWNGERPTELSAIRLLQSTISSSTLGIDAQAHVGENSSMSVYARCLLIDEIERTAAPDQCRCRRSDERRHPNLHR